MFFTYVTRELRRRRRQAVVVALGLGLGIGLVVTVSAMAAGVRQAQRTVLKSLYGVGTDIAVTRPATSGSGQPPRFGLNPGGDQQQGQAFSRDRVVTSPGLATLSEDTVAKVSEVDHVRSAAGGLTLTSIHLSGRFASAPPSGGGFGPGQGGSTAAPSVPPVRISTYSITGVDVSTSDVGPVGPSQIASGRYFASSEANSKVAIVDRGYAKQHSFKVGSIVTIGGTKFTVIGIAAPAAGGQTSDVYLPLARAQALADATGSVNRIYVKADSASNIPAIRSAIQTAFPKATVTTAQDLASQVSGSLAGASSLAGNLGSWLSIAALIAAFAVASLLTLSAVGRRTREFGTLKAIGWRSRRVVGQVMGESVVQGIFGGILGIAIGLGGAFLVSKLAPSLQATIDSTPSAAAGPGGGFGPPGVAQALASTVTVPLTAPLSVELLIVAIGLALLGGVIAGSLGGWRAARLRPAEALRRVE